jgi:hypothetical protein
MVGISVAMAGNLPMRGDGDKGRLPESETAATMVP